MSVNSKANNHNHCWPRAGRVPAASTSDSVLSKTRALEVGGSLVRSHPAKGFAGMVQSTDRTDLGKASVDLAGDVVGAP
jgi:hypothetical protein